MRTLNFPDPDILCRPYQKVVGAVIETCHAATQGNLYTVSRRQLHTFYNLGYVRRIFICGTGPIQLRQLHNCIYSTETCLEHWNGALRTALTMVAWFERAQIIACMAAKDECSSVGYLKLLVIGIHGAAGCWNVPEHAVPAF